MEGPGLVAGSKSAASLHEVAETLVQTIRNGCGDLHDKLGAYSTAVRNAQKQASDADAAGADLQGVLSGPETRGPWLAGWDGKYQHFTFESRHVRSMPLVDHEGRAIGVSFPTRHTGQNPDRKAYRAWSRMPTRLSDTEFVPETRIKRPGRREPEWQDRGPARPAPWATDAQEGMLYVHAHATRRGFEIEADVGTDDDPDWRILLAPGRFFGHVLAADRHFRAASGAASNQPLLLLACDAGNPDYRQDRDAARVLHDEGLRHDVYATVAINRARFDRENGIAEVGIEVPEGSSPTDAVVVTRAPPPDNVSK